MKGDLGEDVLEHAGRSHPVTSSQIETLKECLLDLKKTGSYDELAKVSGEFFIPAVITMNNKIAKQSDPKLQAEFNALMPLIMNTPKTRDLFANIPSDHPIAKGSILEQALTAEPANKSLAEKMKDKVNDLSDQGENADQASKEPPSPKK